MAGHQGDAAPVLPGRRQDPAGRQRPAQPLVERARSTSPAAASPPVPWARSTATRSSPSTSTSSTTSCSSPPWTAGRRRSRSRASRSPPSTTRPSRPWPSLGITVAIAHPQPFDLPDADRPFAEDTEHASYDPAWASRYWQVLSQVNLVLEEFAARFSGKVSPVHHFWHTFDIAHTRFSDRQVDQPPTADPVTREAYSREVISFGFWFGDDRFAEPAFYSYTAPEPAGLAERAAAAGGRPVGSARRQPPGRPALRRRPRQRRPARRRAGASTRAPTRPGPGAPAGTSGAWPAPAGSPTRTCPDPRPTERNYLSYRPVEPRRRHAWRWSASSQDEPLTRSEEARWTRPRHERCSPASEPGSSGCCRPTPANRGGRTGR